MLRQRRAAAGPSTGAASEMQPDNNNTGADEHRPLLEQEQHPQLGTQHGDPSSPVSPPADGSWSRRNQWIILAIASGACAAFNGVFAKLTTTELTSSFANGVTHFLGTPQFRGAIEVALRGVFFGLNLVFNGVMWTLFTKALARGHSSTQVSIMNTSTNFMVTALAGAAIFSESLPPLWWLGAAMLVAGNVVMGRKDESGVGDEAPSSAPEEDAVHAAQEDGVFAPTAQQPGLVPREDAEEVLEGVLAEGMGTSTGVKADVLGGEQMDDSQVVIVDKSASESAENGR